MFLFCVVLFVCVLLFCFCLVFLLERGGFWWVFCLLLVEVGLGGGGVEDGRGDIVSSEFYPEKPRVFFIYFFNIAVHN